MKNDITYEYRKFVKRPDLTVGNLEIGECTYDVLTKELKKPLNGRLYHTTDTNQFFYDFNNKRYELNWLGKSSSIDDATLNKALAGIKKDIADLKKNGAGLSDSDRELLNQVKTLLDGLDVDALNSAAEKVNGFDSVVANAKNEINSLVNSGKEDIQNAIDNGESDIDDYVSYQRLVIDTQSKQIQEQISSLVKSFKVKVQSLIDSADSDIDEKVNESIKNADIQSLVDTAVQNAIDDADSDIDEKVNEAIEDANIDKKVQDAIDEKLDGLDPSVNSKNISVYSNVESPYRTVVYSLEPKDVLINETTDGTTYTSDYLSGFDDNKTITGFILDLVFTGKENANLGAMISINVPSDYTANIMYNYNDSDSDSDSTWISYKTIESAIVNGRVTYTRDSNAVLVGPLNLKLVVYKK